MEKFLEAKKRKVTEVKLEPKTNGILSLGMKHNHYTMSSTLVA